MLWSKRLSASPAAAAAAGSRCPLSQDGGPSTDTSRTKPAHVQTISVALSSGLGKNGFARTSWSSKELAGVVRSGSALPHLARAGCDDVQGGGRHPVPSVTTGRGALWPRSYPFQRAREGKHSKRAWTSLSRSGEAHCQTVIWWGSLFSRRGPWLLSRSPTEGKSPWRLTRMMLSLSGFFHRGSPDSQSRLLASP